MEKLDLNRLREAYDGDCGERLALHAQDGDGKTPQFCFIRGLRG